MREHRETELEPNDPAQVMRLEDLLTELLAEIRSLLKVHNASEVVHILAERRHYRSTLYKREDP